jgi:hypothetical protein
MNTSSNQSPANTTTNISNSQPQRRLQRPASPVQNGLFLGLDAKTLAKAPHLAVSPQEAEAAFQRQRGGVVNASKKTPCIKLMKGRLTSHAFGTALQLSEALVAYDTQSGKIVRLIHGFIPGVNEGDVGYEWKLGPSCSPLEAVEVPAALYYRPAFLDRYKLPQEPGIEFRLLRAVASTCKSNERFSLLTFAEPPYGSEQLEVDRRTLREERTTGPYGEGVDTFFELEPYRDEASDEPVNDWHEDWLLNLGDFAGVGPIPNGHVQSEPLLQTVQTVQDGPQEEEEQEALTAFAPQVPEDHQEEQAQEEAPAEGEVVLLP